MIETFKITTCIFKMIESAPNQTKFWFSRFYYV
jgi:hypothetical protein